MILNELYRLFNLDFSTASSKIKLSHWISLCKRHDTEAYTVIWELKSGKYIFYTGKDGNVWLNQNQSISTWHDSSQDMVN